MDLKISHVKRYLDPTEGFYSAVSGFGQRVIQSVANFGFFVMYVRDVAKQCFRRPVRWGLIFQHLEFIGNQSLSIILLTALALGAVFGLLVAKVFSVFRAESMTGGASAIAFTRELAPLVTTFLLAGRAGSAMTAELATMRVNEQIDAMEAMGVDPIDYLVAPRFIASIFITPFLTGVFMLVSLVGSFAICVLLFDVDQGIFFDRLRSIAQAKDVFMGLEKALVFAALVAIISCRYGLRASGGAKGVGLATTNSVIVTMLSILGFDFVLSYIQTILL